MVKRSRASTSRRFSHAQGWGFESPCFYFQVKIEFISLRTRTAELISPINHSTSIFSERSYASLLSMTRTLKSTWVTSVGQISREWTPFFLLLKPWMKRSRIARSEEWISRGEGGKKERRTYLYKLFL